MRNILELSLKNNFSAQGRETVTTQQKISFCDTQLGEIVIGKFLNILTFLVHYQKKYHVFLGVCKLQFLETEASISKIIGSWLIRKNKV